MAKIAANSGDRSADIVSSPAEGPPIGVGVDQGARVSDRLGAHRQADSRPQANRSASMPAASPMPPATPLPPASAIPAATPVPGAAPGPFKHP
jgi:hypothetical protein